METDSIRFRRIAGVGILLAVFALAACSTSTGEDWNSRVADRKGAVASIGVGALGAHVVDCKSSSLVGRGSEFASVGWATATAACWEWASGDPQDAMDSTADAIRAALPAMPREADLPSSCHSSGLTTLAFLPSVCSAAILDPSSRGSYFLVMAVPDYDESGYIQQLFDEKKSLGYLSEDLMKAVPDVRVEMTIFYLDPFVMEALPTS